MTNTATSTDRAIDQRLVRALGHPLRQRILQYLNERSPASPSEIAEALDESLGRVSYHVRILLDNVAIELVRTAQVRGAIEHFYRPLTRPMFDDAHWSRLPASTRRALAGQTAGWIFEDVGEAAARGAFEHPTVHVSRTLLELDDEAYTTLTARIAEVMEQALDLHAQTAARSGASPDGDRELHRTELAMLHFHRAPATAR